jgi:hypothetical protein
METYWACDENQLSHIETEAEKQCNSKTELASFAGLWKF